MDDLIEERLFFYDCIECGTKNLASDQSHDYADCMNAHKARRKALEVILDWVLQNGDDATVAHVALELEKLDGTP